MFLRLAIFWLFGFSQISCAQPIYEQVSNIPVSADDSKSANDSCQLIFDQLGYCLKWDWIEYPTSTQAGSLWVKVTRPNEFDSSDVPVELEINPKVILWMPTMGHGSTPTQVERVDVGTYTVTNVFFVMPGEWEIRFQVVSPQQVADEIIVPIRF